MQHQAIRLFPNTILHSYMLFVKGIFNFYKNSYIWINFVKILQSQLIFIMHLSLTEQSFQKIFVYSNEYI